MSFIIIGAAMLLVAVGIMALPLLRQRQAAPLEAAAANRELYVARLDELRVDLETGSLAAEDFESARRDLEADLQADDAAPKPAGRRRGWWAAIAVAAIVPIATAVLYLQWGNWQSALYGDGSMQAVVANVQDRLQQSPNDPEGWAFLGRIYSTSLHYDKALHAFHRAVALTGGNNAAMLAALGSTEMLANNMQTTPATAALFDKVLKLDPDNTRGLLFGGIVAMQQGDKTTAVKRWQRLLSQNPPAPLRRILTARIKAAGGVVAGAGTAAAAAAPARSIQVDVKLAAALKAKVPAHATLFVFVRPVGSKSGPPLAVRRLSVDQFPVTVKLSDANAMIPGRHLEDYKNLRVVARISKSGAPLQQAGDVYGSAKFAWSDKSAPLNIVLNQVVSD
ncbi:MAG TPA: c-type cytochrome biogenesis protein CcmI [Gammaproteobacteria bacterium]|nr:c-type cytochrome biogenesis protein CcmI [Gammaproteobacteria bacterium]